jgi:chromosome segregation ATPase
MSDDPTDLIKLLNSVATESTEVKDVHILDHKFSSAETCLSRLLAQQERLTNRLQRLQEANEKVSSKQIEGKPRRLQMISLQSQGTFFQQLRILETTMETVTSERDGLLSQVRNLKGAISEASAKGKRYAVQVARLENQLNDVEIRTATFSKESSERLRELLDLGRLVMQAKVNCERVKAQIHEVAQQQVRVFTTEQNSRMLALRKTLEDCTASLSENASQHLSLRILNVE